MEQSFKKNLGYLKKQSFKKNLFGPVEKKTSNSRIMSNFGMFPRYIGKLKFGFSTPENMKINHETFSTPFFPETTLFGAQLPGLVVG